MRQRKDDGERIVGVNLWSHEGNSQTGHRMHHEEFQKKTRWVGKERRERVMKEKEWLCLRS